MAKTWSIYIPITSFVLFLLWSITDHLVLVAIPMPMRHMLFLVVGTVLASLTAWVATATLVKQYRRLRELEKLRDDLTHMTIHDLRTPLTNVMVALETIETGSFGKLDNEMERLVEISARNSSRLLNMIDNMLDISRMEANHIKLDLSVVSIPEIVSLGVDEMRHQACRKGIQLCIQLQSEEIEVVCDEDKVRRVLMNLLDNAVKFTSKNGTITVGATEDANDVSVYVTDTGVGIPEEFHKIIFEKFGQVQSQESGCRRSQGLGLAFCKLAIEAHGGRIWVNSHPATGTTFRLSLPKQMKIRKAQQ